MGVSISELKSTSFWTPSYSISSSFSWSQYYTYNRDDFNNYTFFYNIDGIKYLSGWTNTVYDPIYAIPYFASNVVIDIGSGGGGGGSAYRPDGGAHLFCAGGGGAGGNVARFSIRSGSGALNSNTFKLYDNIAFFIGKGGIGGSGGAIDGENGGISTVEINYGSGHTVGRIYGGNGGTTGVASPFTYETGIGGSPNPNDIIANWYSLGGSGSNAGLFFSGGGGGGAATFNIGGSAVNQFGGVGGSGDPNGGNGGAGRTTIGFGGGGTVYGGGGGGGYLPDGTGEAIRNGGAGANGYFKMFYDENIVQYLFFGNTPGVVPMEYYTWTVPGGVSCVLIECWGGGGQGGEGVDDSIQRGEGGGGAGGSYARKLLNVSSGDQLFLEIPGWSGYAPDGSATGNQGGTTTVKLNNTTVVCRAVGGVGGGKGVGNAMGIGGLGSTTGCVGDTVYKGGDGATAVDFPNRSGAGGGGASALGIGNSATGDPTYTPGAHKPQFGGKGGAALNDGGDGNPGYDFGGGGGGGFSPPIGRRSGGPGAPGIIQLTIKYSTPGNFLIFFNPS